MSCIVIIGYRGFPLPHAGHVGRRRFPLYCLFNELFFFFFMDCFGGTFHPPSCGVSTFLGLAAKKWAPSSAHEPLPCLHWVLWFNQTFWKMLRMDFYFFFWAEHPCMANVAWMKKYCWDHIYATFCAVILHRDWNHFIECVIYFFFIQCVQNAKLQVVTSSYMLN